MARKPTKPTTKAELPKPLPPTPTDPVRTREGLLFSLARAFEETHRQIRIRNTPLAPTEAMMRALDELPRDRAREAERAAELTAEKVALALGGGNDGGPKADWKIIACRLLEKLERGEPYTTLRDLEKELGCRSNSTIRKAIRKSKSLTKWQAEGSGRTTAPKATGLDRVKKDNMHQTKEPAPDDYLPDDDMEIVLAELRDQVTPEERARLDDLDDAERRALVAEYQAQNLDDEPSPLEPDTPGQRPREVRHHKRA